MERLKKILQKIHALDTEKIAFGQMICDNLAKPIGSLGKIEQIYARLYAMFPENIDIHKKVVIVYAADNGVVDENISANPQETTIIVSKNILKGETGLCALSRYFGSDVHLVDIGCKEDIYPHSKDKVLYGTQNIHLSRAMTRQECIQAILVGYNKTKELISEGYTLFGTGEMGIGNTTTSAAVICAILHANPKVITGYGAGLTSKMKQHKTSIIQETIQFHSPYTDVIDIVSKLGGLDMLGIAGTFLACAEQHIPCVVDGLISATGLLIAHELNPHVLDYAFASHISTEPGYTAIANHLNLSPMLLMDMRLGEGSGCPLAFSLIEASVYTIENMPKFENSLLKKEDYIDIRTRK